MTLTNTMNTSETSTPDLIDKKIRAICALVPLESEKEWIQDFVNLWDLSVPLAVMVQRGWVTDLGDDGVRAIEYCFTALVALLGQPEEEVLEAATE